MSACKDWIHRRTAFQLPRMSHTIFHIWTCVLSERPDSRGDVLLLSNSLLPPRIRIGDSNRDYWHSCVDCSRGALSVALSVIPHWAGAWSRCSRHKVWAELFGPAAGLTNFRQAPLNVPVNPAPTFCRSAPMSTNSRSPSPSHLFLAGFFCNMNNPLTSTGITARQFLLHRCHPRFERFQRRISGRPQILDSSAAIDV